MSTFLSAFFIQCISQCSNIQNAFATCTGTAYLCTTLATSGSACSACFANDGYSFNASYARVISVAMVTDYKIMTHPNSGGITKLLIGSNEKYLGILFWGFIALLIAGCFL